MNKTAKVSNEKRLLSLVRYIAAGMGNLPLKQHGAEGVHGINDGKMRAIYLENFVTQARQLLEDIDG